MEELRLGGKKEKAVSSGRLGREEYCCRFIDI